MANIKYKVCVLTVTYANRWQFLEQVLKRSVLFEYVKHIVVVNNASVYNVDDKVAELNDSRIIVLNNVENTGSAGGYKQAITYAYRQTNADYIWLLDDDNLPNHDALAGLLKMWNTIEGENSKKALYCLRTDRIPHVKIALGENPDRYYLVPDNFMGFSILNSFKNQFYKFRSKIKQNGSYLEKVMMPYVPYGGLLMHRLLVAKIGYPDDRFFVYADDSEYTYRITQSGAVIWLIPTCRVVDIDQSQGITYKQKPLRSYLLDEWSFRTYYAVRNRMYFYSRVAIRFSFIFKLNKSLYLFYLWVISKLSMKQNEYTKFLAAVNDGLKGSLGKAGEDKF